MQHAEKATPQDKSDEQRDGEPTSDRFDGPRGGEIALENHSRRAERAEIGIEILLQTTKRSPRFLGQVSADLQAPDPLRESSDCFAHSEAFETEFVMTQVSKLQESGINSEQSDEETDRGRHIPVESHECSSKRLTKIRVMCSR